MNGRLDLQWLQVFKVSGRPDGHYARRIPRSIEIEAGNGRVSQVTSQEDGVQATCRLDVIDIASRAANQTRVLDATNGGTEDGGRHFDECILAVNGQG